MGKINTTNYPNRPVSAYQDDDMFILQDNGGETYTTNVGDIKDLIGEETAPELALKVDKNGTDRLMTAAEGTKLAGIAAGAQVNVLEGVVVDSIVQPISGKKAFIDLSGKTDLSVIAMSFYEMMTYFKGAYVTYNGKLYEFIQEHTGAWNPSHVREIKATGQFVRAGNGGYNSGDRATCEGYFTKASGNYSHAEGKETQAEGEASHAEGTGTIANSDNQHVEGKYNIPDTDDKYAHIVGNGTADNARSNALTLDWDGNLEVSGDVEDGNGEKISDKADKVTNATSGHLAGLDSNGNLTDSGVSPTEEVTVEGNPVTFDSPFEQDAKNVVVSVKPIQDLHGYDHPWEGGTNVNLYDCTISESTIFDVTFSNVSDADGNKLGVKAKGLASNYAMYNVNCPLKAGMYKTFESKTSNNFSFNVRDANGSWLADPGNEFTLAEDTTIKIRYYVNSGVNADDIIYCMVYKYSGTDATAFSPYSNICPISGIDEVEIGVSGKNLFNIADGSLESGKVTISNGLIKINGTFNNRTVVLTDLVDIAQLNKFVGEHLFFSKTNVKGNFDKNQVFFSGGAGAWNFWRSNSEIILDRELTNFVIYIEGTVDVEFYLQVELGSTPTAFEPYNSNSHTTTIPLPSTLYGGDVDVTEGIDTPTYKRVNLSDLDWVYLNPGAFYTTLSDIEMPTSDSEAFDGKSSIAKVVAANLRGTETSNILFVFGNDNKLYTRNFTSENVTDFRTEVAGQTLVYKLSTPTTLSLTPTDVELLEGTNVVTTNGERVAVTYGRSLWQDIDDLKTDTEDKLDKSDVADVEGDTASRPYSVNEFMLRSDGFYKVTQPIAQNASITASNTTKTTIGAVLTALLNA